MSNDVRKVPNNGQTAAAEPFPVRAITGNDFPSQRAMKWLLTVLLMYFGARLIFFAVSISPYVPPDEVTHLGLCKIYSEVSFVPENSPATYSYGLVTNIPYLYYWIMGRLLTLNFFGISDLLFVRLLNIPFAFAAVYFVLRMLRLLTDDRLPQMLLIVAMTNTMMFTFLSASVSYDNLTNLLAAMAVYYLLAFFKNRSGDLLAVSFLCQLAGSLTKVTFLPLVLILNILLLIHEVRNLRLLPGFLVDYVRASVGRRSGLALGILLGLALNIHLYGGNYLHYGSPSPTMAEVLSLREAMQNRIEARNSIFDLFKEGKISQNKALALALQISHPGDSADAIGLIMNYAALKNTGSELMGPLAYTSYWARRMLAGIFGIFSHLEMLNTGPTILPFAALIVLVGLSIMIRWRPGDALWLPSCLLLIAAFYALFLIGVNYTTYLHYGHPELALHGRYIFPVIGPVYVLSGYYLLRLFRQKYARLVLSVMVCITFIGFDFPYFLLRVTRDWFVSS